MNKKGFAISIILYSVVFLVIAIFYLLLGILKARYSAGSDLKSSVVSKLNSDEYIHSTIKSNNSGGISLPSQYKKLVYIQSNATQRINTDVSGDNDNLSFEIKYQWVNLDSGYKGVYGNYVGADSNVTRLIRNNSEKVYSNINTKASGGSTGFTTTLDTDTIYIDRVDSSGYITNNGTKASNTTKGTENNNKIYLFAQNSSGSIASSIRVFYFKIYDGNNLIRHFIPCKDTTTGMAGLYDVVNGVFYQDINNNNFTYIE